METPVLLHVPGMLRIHTQFFRAHDDIYREKLYTVAAAAHRHRERHRQMEHDKGVPAKIPLAQSLSSSSVEVHIEADDTDMADDEALINDCNMNTDNVEETDDERPHQNEDGSSCEETSDEEGMSDSDNSDDMVDHASKATIYYSPPRTGNGQTFTAAIEEARYALTSPSQSN